MTGLTDIIRFFDKFGEIQKHGNKIPHWQQAGACYFVTFRLADSIPKTLQDELEEERNLWVRNHPKPWSPEIEQEYHQQFSRTVDKWLDAGYGECILRSSKVQNILNEVLMFQNKERFLQHSWVVMPNHVHLLFSSVPTAGIDQYLKNWKGISANQINRVLDRKGTVWQKNYFDRIIRNSDHFLNVAKYIRRNPEKAHLGDTEYLHYESEVVKSVLN